MDISALGSQYLASEYIPLSSSKAASPAGSLTASPAVSFAASPAESSGFEEILKKAQNRISGPDMPVSTLPAKIPIDKTDKLYELCQELETFLLKNLIKSMRSTVQKSNLLDSGYAGEIYEDMLYDEYAKTFSHNANFGFAEMAYRDLKRNA